jgi:hypothetical protein
MFQAISRELMRIMTAQDMDIQSARKANAQVKQAQAHQTQQDALKQDHPAATRKLTQASSATRQTAYAI